MNANRIKVLVVEDSRTSRDLLVNLLAADGRMEVVGTASDGYEALKFLETQRPDVVTMDIHMPKMDGFEVTRRIMETFPLPVVIVSSVWRPEEVATTFRAVEAGALAVVATPAGPGHPDHVQDAQRLVDTVRAMSEVKVVRRRGRGPQPQMRLPSVFPTEVRSKIDLVAIGASTGGPTVLQSILAALPKDFPAPLLIVQHIAPGFVRGLVNWLQGFTPLTVKIADPGELALPATAYFAPDGYHLEIRRDGRIHLGNDPPDNGLRPSIARLFTSMANEWGPRGAGVLLTGMGRDGAAELKLMRQRGALTVAQNEESSLVFGMPGEALKLDAAEHVLPPQSIAGLLVMAGVKSPPGNE